MMSSFLQLQSPSGSGSLPSNTVANPRGDVKSITTRSGVTYDGPTIPPNPSPLPKEVERETEATKDKVQSTNLGSIAHVQPPVVRFLQIFQRLHFDIRFADALLHMPKFASTFKSLLNPSPTLPPMKNDDLKQVDVTMTKPLIEEPPELELKDLPSHLEYAFLEGTDKLPVIISKELKDEEKTALLKVLKSHKRANTWKISDIKGIDPHFCTHKIIMEDDFKPAIQHQRRVNLKIHEVIKKEVIKLLDAGLIYPISDSPWVSPVHCVPKKGGMTVAENEDNELMPTRDYAVGAVLGKRKTKHFQPIHYASNTMTDAQVHYTTTKKELLAVVYAFENSGLQLSLLSYQTIVDTDHSALKYLLDMQDAKRDSLVDYHSPRFCVFIHDKKGAENLATDHLSRLEKSSIL
ncbi:reverse transcriptase domain-containing protein [Tanacetum coccineum]|uniref:Reverse transcriptase domain-containing protein n=1 Tax=Tanacetum coccineum TaxID=301880 RepID=A0ABQ4X3D1_9ASTR